MQRAQELSLTRSAMAGMSNPITTAMRAMPLCCSIDAFHGLASPGQLVRALLFPLLSSVLV
jgi:hypothetical protein